MHLEWQEEQVVWAASPGARLPRHTRHLLSRYINTQGIDKVSARDLESHNPAILDSKHLACPQLPWGSREPHNVD